jgi:hypothetical protein
MIQQQYTINWDYVMSQCPKNEDVLLAIESMPNYSTGKAFSITVKKQ